MIISNKKEVMLLFAGDIVFFLLSLYISLLFRFGTLPSFNVFKNHLFPFSILFVIWIIVFYIAGLYDRRTLVLGSKLPSTIFNSQVANSIIAVFFFYLFPFFGIAPKTILFIYLIVSFVSMTSWRFYGGYLFPHAQPEPAILIGSGQEMKELYEEVNSRSGYSMRFISSINVDDIGKLDIQEEIIRMVYSEGVKFIAIDFSNEKVSPLLPHLYNLIFSKVRFIDSHKIYEDVFDRIPLSLVTYSWFLENISVSPKFTYDFIKRIIDVVLSFFGGVVSLVVYPFVYLAIKIDDKGKIFIYQERVGQNNIPIQLIKFRTMSEDDDAVGNNNREMKITRVGKFLRVSRIDEFPQLWNVFRGDISLIGPRPEFPKLVKLYEKEISFYNVRHLIKPGLSGWAQLYQKIPPKFATDYQLTAEKLSYDLFYIKERSFLLDIHIILKTIKDLLSRRGL